MIKDLLNPSDKVLKIHENPKTGIFVKDLCELIVKDSSDLMRLIEQGNTVRRVAATQMNEQSSRSHSCFTIKVEQKLTTELSGGVTREQVVSAKLNLVDLAGSERASKTGASGQTLKEGAKINLSLMTLGTVINALAAGGQKGHIPYRDSQLTRLLQVKKAEWYIGCKFYRDEFIGICGLWSIS
ncbi:KRP85 [Symbiodinium microadriaticum]|nr:KRP85 [Symbiodinium microadriaticum]